MIKTGGENVASREVEEAIYRMPQVSEVAVIGLPDPKWIEAVTAVVVVKAGQALEAPALVAHCQEHLASFKVPKHVFFCTALPKNPSGKILKWELRQLTNRRVRAVLTKEVFRLAVDEARGAAQSRDPAGRSRRRCTARIELVALRSNTTPRPGSGLRHQHTGGPAACGQYSTPSRRPAARASARRSRRPPRRSRASAISGCQDMPSSASPRPHSAARTSPRSETPRHRPATPACVVPDPAAHAARRRTRRSAPA